VSCVSDPLGGTAYSSSDGFALDIEVLASNEVGGWRNALVWQNRRFAGRGNGCIARQIREPDIYSQKALE
jgi:hypothetical protein